MTGGGTSAGRAAAATPAGRILPPGVHAYDDLRRGDLIETPSVTVTAAMIDAFAALTGDRFAIHMSDEAARDYGFPARVAHGLLVLSVIDGLKNQAGAQFDAVASLHWDWTFRRPVLAGDRLWARITVTAKRGTGRPDRGILRLTVEAVTGAGEVVQTGRNLLMVRRGVSGSGSRGNR